jgi:hypothetical protein
METDGWGHAPSLFVPLHAKAFRTCEPINQRRSRNLEMNRLYLVMNFDDLKYVT